MKLTITYDEKGLTRVVDQETGQPIGGIQDLEVSWSAKNNPHHPEVKIRAFNMHDCEVKDAELKDEDINFIGVGPQLLPPEELTQEQCIEALLHEARENFKKTLKIRQLEEEIIVLKNNS